MVAELILLRFCLFVSGFVGLRKTALAVVLLRLNPFYLSSLPDKKILKSHNELVLQPSQFNKLRGVFVFCGSGILSSKNEMKRALL